MDLTRRDHELHGRRRGRNIGVLVVLLAFAALLFAVTIVKLGNEAATIGNPSAGQAGGWGLQGSLGQQEGQ